TSTANTLRLKSIKERMSPGDKVEFPSTMDLSNSSRYSSPVSPCVEMQSNVLQRQPCTNNPITTDCPFPKQGVSSPHCPWQAIPPDGVKLKDHKLGGLYDDLVDKHEPCVKDCENRDELPGESYESLQHRAKDELTEEGNVRPVKVIVHETNVNSTLESGEVCKSQEALQRVETGSLVIDDSLSSASARSATTKKLMLMPPPPPNVARAKMRRRRLRVCLMHSTRFQRLCGLLRRHGQRDDMLYALIRASGLCEWLRLVEPARASVEHLRKYHDLDYVEALRNPPLDDEKALEEYGLIDDCEASTLPVLPLHFSFPLAASLHAASLLVKGEADIAINWGGGR
ncbi:unnamed protein product, partial [Choristocarpus tenellus]